jgi:hypothetical protein
VIRNVLIGLMLCCGASQSVLAATNAASSSVTNLCPAFTLRDQFEATHSFTFPRLKPAVLGVADKKGSDQIEGWTHPLAERFGERIDIPGLADVSAVPRPLRGVVQSRFKKAIAHPVMLDWDGKVAGAFKYQKGQANVYLIAPDGRVLHHVAGPASAEKLAALSARIEALLSDSSAVQAKARSN